MRSIAPGRVNLIGDHTDYTGGVAMPMAVDLATTLEVRPEGDRVELTSAELGGRVVVPLGEPGTSRAVPGWGSYVQGVVSTLMPRHGLVGTVRTSLPIGAGLASSAALQVALALALGYEGSRVDLALACQQAELRATGVPCGVMDQIASICGVEGHALLVDCHGLRVVPVPVPEEVDVVVVHSGEQRRLAETPYATRRQECEAVEQVIGPLRLADPDAVAELADPVLRSRARHVVSENRRVLDFAAALGEGDLHECGRLMVASHESLKHDFSASTPGLDSLVARLVSTAGVYGARSTGAGFGGCVVALARPGALDQGWLVRASVGAHVQD